MRYDDDYNTSSQEPHRFRPSISVVLGGLGLLTAFGLSALIVAIMAPSSDEPAPVADATPVDEPASDAAYPPLPDAGALPEDMDDAEVADAEAIEAPSPAEQLRAAVAQVESLETEIQARDAELEQIKAELARRDEADEAARARARERQAAVQHQLDSLRVALNEAVDERDGLRRDLKAALAEVDRQLAQNTRLRITAVAYKEASTENLWAAFVNNAKVRICDRGTFRTRADCGAELDAFFGDEQHAEFSGCVNTTQTVPLLWQGEPDEAPAHAELISAHDRERRDDWYVIWCDPTLPPEVVAHDLTDETPVVFAVAQN